MLSDGTNRFDERENVQGRVELIPGTSAWEKFYECHPKLKEIDLENQRLRGIHVGAPSENKAQMSILSVLGQMGREDMVDGPADPEKLEITPERATEKIKGFAKYLGAEVVKIGPLNQNYIYSHKGRTYGRQGEGEPKVGTPIDLSHKNAIVLVKGLDLKLLKGAPKKQVIYTIFRTYSQLANIALPLARFIRMMGYPARAHIVTNYQIVVPPVAVDAGVGELGRNGIVISKEFGQAMKMAVVTTDLPLLHDKKIKVGAEDFCRNCKICAENCPSGAINFGNKKMIRGAERYPFNPEACFKTWNETGTDCGVCLSVCPYSKSQSLHHKAGLWLASRGGELPGKFLSQLERLIKGNHDPGASTQPSWMEEPPDVWKKYRFGKKMRIK